MNWSLEFLPETRKDMRKLDGSQSRKVAKAIDKTRTNPLPRSEGGYGIELGNKGGINLAGCCEIKLRGEGLRVIYKLMCIETKMIVIVIGVREDEDVYNEASKRMKKYRL